MPTYAQNKKAFHDFEILEEYEAGFVLTGAEVKAVRNGQINLKGAFVTFHKERPVITNAHIGHYKHSAPDPNYDPTRSRYILLNKKEIDKIRGKLAEKGLTAVPLSVYTRGRRIKVKVGIAKGKKQYDKRRSIKDKELKREKDRLLKAR